MVNCDGSHLFKAVAMSPLYFCIDLAKATVFLAALDALAAAKGCNHPCYISFYRYCNILRYSVSSQAKKNKGKYN